MTVSEATNIADTALEHAVLCILQAVQVGRRRCNLPPASTLCYPGGADGGQPRAIPILLFSMCAVLCYQGGS